MRPRYSSILVILLLAFLVAGTGCKKKSPETQPETPDTETTRQPPPPPPPPSTREVEEDFQPIEEDQPDTPQEIAADLNARGSLRTIYFAYDSSDITASAQSTLRQNAEVLKAYPQVGVVIEGHCDERGTIEYNLALGERRASAVRDYLTSLGIERSRMRVVTYGEERPVDPGHGESAWSRNRRGEFVAE